MAYVNGEFASSVRELGMGETRLCVDPECTGVMESDQDGDHRFLECALCGYSAFYEKVESPTAVDADGNCSIGVPAEVRRQSSGMVTDAMEQIDKDSGKVSLGLTIGRRPE